MHWVIKYNNKIFKISDHNFIVNKMLSVLSVESIKLVSKPFVIKFYYCMGLQNIYNIINNKIRHFISEEVQLEFGF